MNIEPEDNLRSGKKSQKHLELLLNTPHPQSAQMLTRQMKQTEITKPLSKQPTPMKPPPKKKRKQKEKN